MSESDREKIDRIAAYVDDQRRGEKSWIATWSKFTAYLALATFFFGIGTFSDIRDHLGASPVDYDKLARDNYTKLVDSHCSKVIQEEKEILPGLLDDAVTADLHVLESRQEMADAWLTSVPDTMTDKDRAALRSMLVYYGSATEFLRAAIDRAREDDYHGYTVDVGQYMQASAAFVKLAGDFGFTRCDHPWGVAIVKLKIGQSPSRVG
jgi:hypothetical protein